MWENSWKCGNVFENVRRPQMVPRVLNLTGLPDEGSRFKGGVIPCMVVGMPVSEATRRPKNGGVAGL